MRILTGGRAAAGRSPGRLARHRGRPAAQPACADLGGAVDADQICRVMPPTRVHARLQLPGRLSRPAGGVRLPEADPRRLHQRRQDARTRAICRTSWTPPGRHTVRGRRRAAPRAWCSRFPGCRRGSPADLVQVVQLRPRQAGADQLDTLFKPGTKPLDVIFPVVQRELEKQSGQSDADLARGRPRPGELPELRAHRRRADLLLRPGRAAAEAAGAAEASVPRAARRADARLSPSGGANPYTWPSLVAVTTRRSWPTDTPTGHPVASGSG